jgi:hypothetical protein
MSSSVKAADVNGGFQPLPAFHATNKTLSLIFASFYGTYTQMSDDLWLSAHQNKTAILTASDQVRVSTPEEEFAFDNKVSVLACTEQYQLCNSSPLPNVTSTCTPWLSSSQITEASREEILVLNTDRQWNTSQAIIASAVHSNIYYTIFMLTLQLLAENLASGSAESLHQRQINGSSRRITCSL